MIKTKVTNVLESLQSGAMQRLAELILPAKTAFRLKRIVEQCNKIAKDFDEARIQTYKDSDGVLDESQMMFTWEDDEKRIAAMKDVEALAQDDVELIGERLTLASFGSHCSLRAADLIVLDWLIDTQEAKSTSA